MAAPPSICAFHFSLFSICLPPWLLSLSGCCHGFDQRNGFVWQCGDRRGGEVEVEIGEVGLGGF